MAYILLNNQLKKIISFVFLTLSCQLSFAYSQVGIHNFANVPARAVIKYAGCAHDTLDIPAATINKDLITPAYAEVSAGHWEQHHKHKWKSDSPRGGCLLTSIEISFYGGNYEIDNYRSGGTGFNDFSIVQRSASRFRVMSHSEMTAEKTTAFMSPGFTIHNRSQIPLTVSLEQVGCLYYQNNLLPGKTFDRDTGAVWFTIRAKLYDPNHPTTNQTCAEPVEILIGGAILSVLAPAAGGALYAAMFGGAEVASVAAAGTLGAVEAGAAVATNVAATTAASATAMETAAAATQSLVAKAALALAKGSVLTGGSKIIEAKMEANMSSSLGGQYAGPPWPFRCTRKPEYEIIGGPDFSKLPQYKTVDEVKQAIIDALSGDAPLKIKKINDCG